MAKSICAGYAFNSGTSPCPFDPAKIKGILLATSKAAFTDGNSGDFTSEPTFERLVYNDRALGRVYPIGGIVNYESGGGEAQTSQVGYGATRITGYSEKQMTFTLDHYDFNLRSTIAEARGTQFYVMFVDEDNRIYGLYNNDGSHENTGKIDGVPVGNIAVGGQDFSTTDPAALQITLYINDYEDMLKNLRYTPLDWNIVDALEGLTFVDTEFATISSGTSVSLKVTEHYSGANISAYVAEMLTAGSATSVLSQTITAVSYDSAHDYIVLTTTAAATDFTGFVGSMSLYTASVFGIEQW